MNKAIVLAGGKGIRIQSCAEDLPKPMLTVGGRPILEYITALLKKSGIKELYMIVGYRQELIRDHFGDGGRFGVKIEYLENRKVNDKVKSGLSDAVLLVEDIIKEPFITILGDEIYAGTDHAGIVKAFENSPDCECMIGVMRVGDREAIKKNYSVRLEGGMKVADLEEKPEAPFNDLLGCGTYLFRPSVFGYIKKTPVSAKSGRKELADTMRMMVEGKKIVKAYDLGGKYVNINYPEDLKAAEGHAERLEQWIK
ncbi:MAG: NTP transferase domain-containing protein [Endomicrobiales bacterium]|nr:NTP transferase domain-containing protein [Endomicrobiales bacterium]